MSEGLQEAQFDETPQGWAKRWALEFASARKAVEKWHTQAEKIVERYLDERDKKTNADTRWNLFTTSVQTKMAMLYGQTPKVTVGRRFADAGDDIGRVAGEQLERLLNSDIQREDDNYSTALNYALIDRFLAGMSSVRVRYVARFESVEVPPKRDPATGRELAPGYVEEKKTFEDVETDYVYWKDQLWSPARTFHEVRWWAFKNDMSREELVKRFGEEIGRNVPLNAKRKPDGDEASKIVDPWARAEVWEVWDKERKKVCWYVEGYPQVLDVKDDPLGLVGFFPFPRPMVANLTTSKFMPRPDYVLAQDLYTEIDLVSTRITLLERAIRVAGVYNKTSEGVKRLVADAVANELIPVENWAMFAEKGGVKGQIDWLPLEMIVNALSVLRDYRRELIDGLYQITGESDIMRGQATAAGTSATEQAIKARFGSVRIQAMQDEFARFASDVQKLKAEIIAKHFDVQTILQRCGCEFTPDAQLAPQAAELIKSDFAKYRIEVKPEAVSLQDFAALKQERMEVLQGLTQFIQAMAPLAQQMPGSLPFVLQMLQWAMAGIRGSSEIEGVIDQAITAAQQMAQQPQQQPPQDMSKLLAIQAKNQGDMQKEQAKLQADLVRINAEVQADERREQNQAQWNTREAMQKALISRALKPQMPSGGNGGLP